MKSSKEPWRFSIQLAQRALALRILLALILRHGVWQIAVDAARTEVGRMHARTTDRFVHVEQIFTLAEGVNQDGRCCRNRCRANPATSGG